MQANTIRTGYAIALVVIALWAGFVLVSRMGGTGTLQPADIAALRLGTATLVLAPFWLLWLRVPLFTPRMLMLALVGGIAYSLTVYSGFRLAPVSHGALLVSGLLPFTMAICVWYVLGEAPTQQMKRGLALIATGVACLGLEMFLHGDYSVRIAAGDALLVSASLLWALYTALVRRWQYGPWETTIGVALLSAMLYLPAYALLRPQAILQADIGEVVLQSLYQGVLVLIVAMVLYMQAMVRLGPARLGAMMATVPAIAGIGASLWLDEPLTPWLVVGLLLTSVGAWVGVRQRAAS